MRVDTENVFSVIFKRNNDLCLKMHTYYFHSCKIYYGSHERIATIICVLTNQILGS